MKLQKLMMMGAMVALAMLTGCVHYTTPIEPEKTQVEIEQGKALVVLYGDTQGISKSLFLMDGEKLVNALSDRREKVFYQAELGHHLFAITQNNGLPFGGHDFTFLEGNLEAGKVYYISGHTYENSLFFTGTHAEIKNTTMKGAKEGGDDGVLQWLLFDKLHKISADGIAYFEGKKESVLERYREQLQDAKEEGTIIQLRASVPNPTKVILHNGKHM